VLGREFEADAERGVRDEFRVYAIGIHRNQCCRE